MRRMDDDTDVVIRGGQGRPDWSADELDGEFRAPARGIFWGLLLTIVVGCVFNLLCSGQ